MSNEHITDERAAFESEMRCEEVWGHRSLEKTKNGRYKNWLIAFAWDIWQARAALRPAAQPAVPAPVASAAPMSERDALRAAQSAAVMPLIGPLLDAWENADREVMSAEPELSRQLAAINRAMEGADAAQQTAPAVPAAHPVGEPVGVVCGHESSYHRSQLSVSLLRFVKPGTNLYTTPQPSPERVPMTDEQIHDLATELELDDPRADLLLFAKAVEAHHGITTPKADK